MTVYVKFLLHFCCDFKIVKNFKILNQSAIEECSIFTPNSS